MKFSDERQMGYQPYVPLGPGMDEDSLPAKM